MEAREARSVAWACSEETAEETAVVEMLVVQVEKVVVLEVEGKEKAGEGKEAAKRILSSPRGRGKTYRIPDCCSKSKMWWTHKDGSAHGVLVPEVR